MNRSKPKRLTRYVIPSSHFSRNGVPPLEVTSRTGNNTQHFLWKLSPTRTDKNFGSRIDLDQHLDHKYCTCQDDISLPYSLPTPSMGYTTLSPSTPLTI